MVPPFPWRSMAMFPTVEVRWFYTGIIPREVLAWFQQGAYEPDQPSCRVDHYLRLGDIDSLGIKLREGRIEIKQRYGQQTIVRFHEHVAGVLEGWCKWSLALAEPVASLPDILIPASCWVAVQKERQVQRYQVVGHRQIVTVPAQRFPEQGCTLELTSIQARATAWWSLAFEAFGDETSLRDNLLLTVEQVLAHDGVPCSLEAADSYGYPAWLAMLGQ
jgi:hypothetical protein